MKLILFHTMDPRGTKLGGIETHVRLVAARYPTTMELLFVGIDEIGDSALGIVRSVEAGGRTFDFLPVARIDATTINTVAKRIAQSTTLRFALGALRHLGAIRRAARGPVSCEVERFEFAILPRLLRRPFVLIVHNDGSRKDKMDGLLRRYWFLQTFNERLALMLADRIFAVNEAFATRISSLIPKAKARMEVMPVSIDTKRFACAPFPIADDAFHVCFAGRLDDFKDPPLMFATLARLDAMLATRSAGRFRRLIFDYVGASDPTRFPEYAAITALTTRHGIRQAPEVATIMKRAHAGIITSYFEGMPCYLLEMLATGRPVVAIRLPQFAPLIDDGISGMLVDRGPTQAGSADALATAFFELATLVDREALDPTAICERVRPYSVDAQMGRLFACHEAIAAGV